MSRPKMILQSEFPYSVASRSRNRDWYDLPLEEVWQLMTEYLYLCKHAFNLQIHQFVLMSNHYHLVVTTPDSNLPDAMAYFNKATSEEIQRLTGRRNQIYGSRYYRTIISKAHYFLNTYKYIYRNPVQARVCDTVESYPFSTLYGLLGKSNLLVPLLVDTTLFSDPAGTLAWLNRTTNPIHDIEMSRALRRSEFCLPSFRKKPSELETILY
jgi:putative transposase